MKTRVLLLESTAMVLLRKPEWGPLPLHVNRALDSMSYHKRSTGRLTLEDTFFHQFLRLRSALQSMSELVLVTVYQRSLIDSQSAATTVTRL